MCERSTQQAQATSHHVDNPLTPLTPPLCPCLLSPPPPQAPTAQRVELLHCFPVRQCMCHNNVQCCMSICASRLPQPQKAELFDTPAAPSHPSLPSPPPHPHPHPHPFPPPLHPPSLQAPTAQKVELLHWWQLRGGEPEVHPMTRNSKGVWTITRPNEWKDT
jgi:hypothetical protein